MAAGEKQFLNIIAIHMVMMTSIILSGAKGATYKRKHIPPKQKPLKHGTRQCPGIHVGATLRMSGRKGFTARDVGTGWIAMSDLISRKSLCEFCLNTKDRTVDANDIMRFPSAEPERVAKAEVVEKPNVFKCSECGQYFHSTSWGSPVEYCSRCGARLEWE